MRVLRQLCCIVWEFKPLAEDATVPSNAQLTAKQSTSDLAPTGLRALVSNSDTRVQALLCPSLLRRTDAAGSFLARLVRCGAKMHTTRLNIAVQPAAQAPIASATIVRHDQSIKASAR